MLQISRAVAPTDFLNPVGRHDWCDWIDAIASVNWSFIKRIFGPRETGVYPQHQHHLQRLHNAQAPAPVNRGEREVVDG